MGQVIKSVCVCLSVYLSVGTLRVAFFDRFLPKLAQTSEPPQVKTSLLGSISHHPFLCFAPNPILGKEVPKIHANVSDSPKFPRVKGNQRPGTLW